MRRRALMLVAFALAVPLLSAQDGKRVVCELDAKGVAAPADGRADRPRVIATAAELAAAVPDEAARMRLAEGVNFEAEQLLLFAWTGAADDALTHEVKAPCKGGVSAVVFTHKAGGSAETKDHTRLFVVRKDKRTTWQVARRAGS